MRGNVVGVLQLINSKNPDGNVRPFPAEEEPLLANFAESAASAVERAKLTRGIIMRMNKMAELRDPGETGAHVKRVSAYSVTIYESWARKQQISAEEVERNRDLLRIAAMLHDVGKVAISDVILKKPGRLTPEEFDTMKQHTIQGARLFEELYSDMDEAAATVALNHHERWDGNGYPGIDTDGEMGRGKRGEEIPLFGRIVAIADVYDALRSKRCYKDAWDDQACLDHLQREAGHHFDPQLIEAFFDNLEAINHASELYPEIKLD
jgi:putative nucleotidyltransferase with HDIG domain